MTLLKGKQVRRMLITYIRLNDITVIGDSVDVSDPIEAFCLTGGDLGKPVPFQTSEYTASSQKQGTIVTAPNNRMELYDHTTKDRIVDGSGNEVYGRLVDETVVPGTPVYVAQFYSMVAGVETVYSFAVSTDVDFESPYLFAFGSLPYNALIGVIARNVNEDPTFGVGRPIIEVLTIAAPDTVPNVQKTPITGSLALEVNGLGHDSLTGSGVTVVGKAITWASALTGYTLLTTDRVVAKYRTFDS